LRRITSKNGTEFPATEDQDFFGNSADRPMELGFGGFKKNKTGEIAALKRKSCTQDRREILGNKHAPSQQRSFFSAHYPETLGLGNGRAATRNRESIWGV